MTFYDWLLSLSTMFSRIIYTVAYLVYYLVWLNDIPLYVYVTICLSVSADECLGCFYFLAIVHTAETKAFIHVLSTCFQWFWSCTEKWNFCVHMVILGLSFWGTAILLFTVVAPFYIPTSSGSGFRFLHILTNACY